MSAIGNSEYEFIRQLVYQHSRINLGADKQELVAARVAKRLRATGIADYKQYCDYLKSPNGEDELGNLVDVISTNHTFFFRETQHFDFLQTVALPQITERLSSRNEWPLRLWSAASSSGEEPYSLAIHFAEFFNGQNSRWEIEGTDISTRILEKARSAVFPSERLGEMKQELLRKYFQKGVGRMEGYFRVKEDLRTKVNFSHINLLQPSYPFTKPFHIIFCRNVMIYFDRPTQEELVAKLSNNLVPGGYLMIGHSESLTSIKHSFKSIKPAIYQKPGNF